MSGKLRLKWIGFFVVINVFFYGTVEIQSEFFNKSFKVNGYRLKLFFINFFLVEIEYKVYWAVKICNFFMDQVGEERKL